MNFCTPVPCCRVTASVAVPARLGPEVACKGAALRFLIVATALLLAWLGLPATAGAVPTAVRPAGEVSLDLPFAQVVELAAFGDQDDSTIPAPAPDQRHHPRAKVAKKFRSAGKSLDPSSSAAIASGVERVSFHPSDSVRGLVAPPVSWCEPRGIRIGGSTYGHWIVRYPGAP